MSRRRGEHELGLYDFDGLSVGELRELLAQYDQDARVDIREIPVRGYGSDVSYDQVIVIVEQ